jgi:hypothetical protein
MIKTKRHNRKNKINNRKTKRNTRKTKKNNVKGGGIKSKLKRFFGIDKKKDYLNDRNNVNRAFDSMKKSIKVPFYKQIKNRFNQYKLKNNQYKLKDKNNFRWVTDSNGNNILEILLADNKYRPESRINQDDNQIEYLYYDPNTFTIKPNGKMYESYTVISELKDNKGNIIAMRINNGGPMYPYKIKSLDETAIFKLTLDNQEKMNISISPNEEIIELPRLYNDKPVYVLSQIIKKSRLSYLNKAYDVFKMHKNNDYIYVIDNIINFNVECNQDINDQTKCSYSLKNNQNISKPSYYLIFQGSAHLINNPDTRPTPYTNNRIINL